MGSHSIQNLFVLLVPGLTSNQPSAASSHLSHGTRQSARTDSPGLLSTGPIITLLFPIAIPPVFRQRMLEVAVTLYDCVSSHFPPCVSYSCAVRCNTHLPLLQQFFRTPLAGKRRDTYRSIFLVRVFLFFLFSDPLLALQQRSSEVREGRHLVLHQMQHFLPRPRPRASRLLLLDFALSASMCEQQIFV